MTRPPRLAGAFAAAVLTALAGAQNGLPPAIDGDEFAARRQHWAWQPLADVKPPTDAAQPVDAFVDAGLAAAGVRAAPPAAPHTLLRRLWFDLVGLPPDADAQRRFLVDGAATDAAYEREVDLLLASPAFGERWARHWLDLVRYAETLGHESDFAIPGAWRYRDYVIRAVDADVPFDRFVQEHVAGDLLPEPRRSGNGENESVQATAFWWFAEQTHSPVDARQQTSDRIDNQIDVFGKAVLGMTVACARCHDHKFDAIRAADYYALAGFLRSSRYVQQPLFAHDPEGPEFAAAFAAQRALTKVWTEAGLPIPAEERGDVRLRDGDTVLSAADGPAAAWIVDNDAFGPAPWRDAWCSLAGDGPLELRRLPGAWWHSGVAGTARDGVLATQTFAVTQPFVHVRVAGRGSRVQVVIDGLNLLRDPIYGGLHRGVDRAEPHWLTFDLRAWQGSAAYVQCLDQRAPDLADQQRGDGSYPADAWLAVQTVIASEHAQPPDAEGTGQVVTAPIEPPAAVAAAADELRRVRAALRVAPTLPAMGEGTGTDSHLFLRGRHDLLGPVVPRRFLQALGGDAADSHGSGRLALARAVFAADNPLPARVFVNRIWHHLFGAGLARTVDNLGALGEPASDPALLDWLARDFIANGWSRKHVIRRIVLSAAYRRATTGDPASDERDPRNLLLHRQNVRRLEAEAVRDALLATSGLLREQRFGPPIPLPHGQLDRARGMPPESGPLDGAGRRSIYLAVRRNFLSPMLQAFDLPTPFATVGARSVSNVPAQALTLLNDEFVHLACAAWAQRLGDDRRDLDAGLDRAYRTAFTRLPDAAERARCREFLAAAAERHAAPIDSPEPWTDLLHCLVVTKEFTFRR